MSQLGRAALPTLIRSKIRRTSTPYRRRPGVAGLCFGLRPLTGGRIDHASKTRQCWAWKAPILVCTMKPSTLTSVLLALAMAGCSGTSGLSTSSIFGANSNTATAQPPPPPVSDPTARAFQVGTVSARAVKCGYNFDPAKLKASFLAAEAGQGATADDLSRIEKVYDISFNGVTKAVAAEPNYCGAEKTQQIKADLGRHLAGDYSPTPPKAVAQQDTGLFSGLWDNDSSSKGLDIKPSTYNPF